MGWLLCFEISEHILIWRSIRQYGWNCYQKLIAEFHGDWCWSHFLLQGLNRNRLTDHLAKESLTFWCGEGGGGEKMSFFQWLYVLKRKSDLDRGTLLHSSPRYSYITLLNLWVLKIFIDVFEKKSLKFFLKMPHLAWYIDKWGKNQYQ